MAEGNEKEEGCIPRSRPQEEESPRRMIPIVVVNTLKAMIVIVNTKVGMAPKEGEGGKGPVCVNHEAKGVKKQRAFDAVRAFFEMNWEKITLHMHMKEHEVHQQKGRRQNKRNQRKKGKEKI